MSQSSFHLSIRNDDDADGVAYSEDYHKRQISGAYNTINDTEGFLNIPGHNPEGDNDSGLITSDSDFDKAAEKAGYNVKANG